MALLAGGFALSRLFEDTVENSFDARLVVLLESLVAVAELDDALLAALLVKLFADRQLVVSQEVVLFLVRQMERSFEAARRLVADLDAAGLRDHRGITIPLARAVLSRA